MHPAGNTMLKQPLVSVVIPVYNGQRYIRKTIETALAQTYPSIEIIVVDDGSTDDTADIVGAISRSDDRIHAFRKSNGGVAAARNHGISQARGELIAMLDADDLWHPEKISRQVAELAASPQDVGVVYCWAIDIDENDNVIPPPEQVGSKRAHRGYVTAQLAEECFIETSSAPLLRKSYVERMGGYDVHLKPQGAEDWKLYLGLSEICAFAVVPEYLVGYRQYGASLSRGVNGMAGSIDLVSRWVTNKWPDLPTEIGRNRTYHTSCYLASKALSNNQFREAIYYRVRAHRVRSRFLDFSTIGFSARLLLRTIGLKPATFRRGRSSISFNEFISLKTG